MRDTYVQHGYTLGDVDRLAHVGVSFAYAKAFDYVDRYDAAWHAIAARLCGDSPPTRDELVYAAAAAVDDEVQAQQRHRGYDYATGSTRPSFERYWDVSPSVSSPEDQVIDRIALRQIWPTLSNTHREIITAMALYSDHVLAAEAVGRKYGTFTSHLKNARRQFLMRWHEGETPTRIWGKADRRHSQRRTTAQVFHVRIMQRKRRAAKREASA
jgi:hypothetical protein